MGTTTLRMDTTLHPQRLGTITTLIQAEALRRATPYRHIRRAAAIRLPQAITRT
jgi:hypothetical protein